MNVTIRIQRFFNLNIFSACVVLLHVCFSFVAQGQVESTSYNLMLKSLLAHSVPEVSVPDATRSAGAVFLDAREPEEFRVSHIRNATYVGYDEFDLKNLAKIRKDQPVIVYCSVGYRSEKIAEQLVAAGYENVKNLYGGIFEWVNEGYPVYDASGKPTSKIHAYDKTWGIWLKTGDKVY